VPLLLLLLVVLLVLVRYQLMSTPPAAVLGRPGSALAFHLYLRSRCSGMRQRTSQNRDGSQRKSKCPGGYNCLPGGVQQCVFHVELNTGSLFRAFQAT
jgi:hypothetical protein